MIVGSIAVAVSKISREPEFTVVVLVTFAGAAMDTLTVTVIGGKLAPFRRKSLRVQVTVWAAIMQVQPVPEAAVGVNPAGNVSVTVNGPGSSAVPVLLTVMVYVAPI